MGNPSTQTLLGVKDGITRIRGTWRVYEIAPGETVPALPTLHPAYLLRTPAAKRWAWLDLRALRKAVDAAAEKQGDAGVRAGPPRSFQRKRGSRGNTTCGWTGGHTTCGGPWIRFRGDDNELVRFPFG